MGIRKFFLFRLILSLKIFSYSNDMSSRPIDPNSSDIRSRYWTFLFDNLKRSIEQIYQTCESDRNIWQCQVSLSFLDKNFQLFLCSFRRLYNTYVNVVKILKCLRRIFNTNKTLLIKEKGKNLIKDIILVFHKSHY
jgi:hypothetical protein